MFHSSRSSGRWTLPWHFPVCIATAIVALSTAPTGQAPEPKIVFVQALGQFSLALDGAFGDEGARIRENLDAMDRALAQWNTVVRTYETAMATDIRTAEPALATRMHIALAGVYVDRTRASDALRHLAAAQKLDPSRADLSIFEGLVHSQLAGDDAAGAAAFRRGLAAKVSDAPTIYLAARHLARVGAQDEAERTFQQLNTAEGPRAAQPRDATATPFARLGLIQERPGVEPFFPPVVYVEGFADLRRGNYERAIAGLRQAVARDPLAADPGLEAGALARAAAALREGAVESAAENVDVAIELAPTRSEPHRIRGLVHLADDDSDAAIDSFTTAIRLNASDERARLALADALVRSDRLPEARQALTDTLAVLPQSGRARYQLGLVYQRQGLYSDAVRELTQAAVLEPLLGLNSIYQTLGALARAQQEYDRAIRAFSTRVDLVPNDADAHHELGEMYLRQGRHTEALAEFLVAVMLAPSRTETHASIGQVHLRDGQYEQAAAAARRAVALNASHREGRYVLATSLIRLGRVDEGQRELEVYQKLQAEDTASRSRQLELEGFRRDASISLDSGDYAKAVELLRRVVERDPQPAASHVDLGIALLRAGKVAEAVEAFNAAVARNAGPDAHGYLVQAYEKLGRLDDSRREREIYDRMRREALQRAGTGR
jgi:tetratricopeptide (TPR) repeat protein